VFGISAEDVISAKEIEGVLEFSEVVSRGGHSTYRIFLQGDRTINDADFQLSWSPISALGATFENANNRFVAVNILPDRNAAEIYELLAKGELGGVWTLEEAHCGAQR